MINIKDFKGKIKAAFLDIDGTLLNSSREVTTRTKNAIKSANERGIYTVICSGRSRFYAVNFSKDIGASHFVISSNGADIYDYKNEKTIYSASFDKQLLNQIMQIAFDNNVGFVLNSLNDCYKYKTDKHDDFFITSNVFKTKEEILKFTSMNTVSQIVIKSDDYNNMRRAVEQVKSISGLRLANMSRFLRDNIQTDSHIVFCDITMAEDTKGSALSKLLDYLNLYEEQSAAFGDELNDLAMLERAHIAIAMGNSIDAVKKAADFVTDTNDNDGVALVLEQL